MRGALAFVHTAAVHVATFGALAAEIAPEVPVRHVVAAHLLDQARRAGGVGAELEEQTCRELLAVAAAGATVVTCTCSTLGPCADRAARRTSTPILRLDRAMATVAVEGGPRLLVAACLETTLAATRDLLVEVGRERGRAIEVELLFLAEAWTLFERGDGDAYLGAIAAALEAAAERADAIVLAQASMAGAVQRCRGLGIPVLSSPRPGVEAAVAAYRALQAR